MTKQRLQEKFEKEIIPAMAKEFNIKNKIAVPTISKVVVNMGIGEVAKNAQNLEKLKGDFTTIAGQVPSIRNAKVSIASFNLRAGMPVGLSATLRGNKMFAFLDRLFSIALPRIRDFRGISDKSFDKSGNYTLGLTEHTVFPEIDPTKSAQPHGFEITIVIDGSDPEKSRKLLELLGCPFEKKEETK